jgi:hypothetical protein
MLQNEIIYTNAVLQSIARSKPNIGNRRARAFTKPNVFSKSTDFSFATNIPGISFEDNPLLHFLP